MKKIIVILAFFGSLSLSAQQDFFEGDVKIKGDPRIDSLIQRHIALNEKFPEIDGYRVMIFFDSGNNSKDSALKVIERFHENYPEIPAYLSFHSPYYRVRVGNFRTQMAGERFVHQIKGQYSNAWVIEASIEPPRLNAKARNEAIIREEE